MKHALTASSLLGAASAILLAFPELLLAQGIPEPEQFRLNTCWGGIPCLDPKAAFTKFNDVFFYAAALIALTIFIVGAFIMVISVGNDTLLQSAKRAMKGSLIGLALVAGSYGIYRAINFFIYGPPVTIIGG